MLPPVSCFINGAGSIGIKRTFRLGFHINHLTYLLLTQPIAPDISCHTAAHSTLIGNNATTTTTTLSLSPSYLPHRAKNRRSEGHEAFMNLGHTHTHTRQGLGDGHWNTPCWNRPFSGKVQSNLPNGVPFYFFLPSLPFSHPGKGGMKNICTTTTTPSKHA